MSEIEIATATELPRKDEREGAKKEEGNLTRGKLASKLLPHGWRSAIISQMLALVELNEH